MYSEDISRWIKLEPPSAALNAPNVARMNLTRSPVISWNASAHEMLKQHVQKGDKHLVFNCHGFAERPGFKTPHLSIGTVIHPGNVEAFTMLAPPKVGLNVIWVAACNIGSSKEGDEFCRSIALNASCHVVYAVFSVVQKVRAGHIDDTARADWKYLNPRGVLIKRLEFIGMGTRLGFTYDKT